MEDAEGLNATFFIFWVFMVTTHFSSSGFSWSYSRLSRYMQRVAKIAICIVKEQTEKNHSTLLTIREQAAFISSEEQPKEDHSCVVRFNGPEPPTPVKSMPDIIGIAAGCVLDVPRSGIVKAPTLILVGTE